MTKEPGNTLSQSNGAQAPIIANFPRKQGSLSTNNYAGSEIANDSILLMLLCLYCFPLSLLLLFMLFLLLAVDVAVDVATVTALVVVDTATALDVACYC
jgi:hypothetical protein